MEEKLMKAVRSVVAENGATLLLVALCGSRAFGYAAPQSDCDLRFIYAYPLARYVSVTPVPTELRIKGLDVVGYELGKFLSMATSNGWTAPEMLRSPIWYVAPEFPNLAAELTQLTQAVFLPEPAVHSLVSCAKTYGKRLLHLPPESQNDRDSLVKMNLGRLRVLQAAKYLLQHGRFYPILMRDLTAAVSPSVLPAVELLTAWRAGAASPTPQEWFAAMASVRSVIDELTDALSVATPTATGPSARALALADAYYLRVVKQLG